MFHAHCESNAATVEHHGWQVVSAFGKPAEETAVTRESVGLSDVSWIAKFNLQGSGLENPPDPGPEARAWLLGRGQYLVTCEPPAVRSVWERLRQFQGAGPPLYITDVTSVYTHLMLAGPRSREVLGKLTSLNLSDRARKNLTCAQAGVAHVNAIVLRDDLPGIPAFHLLVGREYGESVWESLLHAGQEFHIIRFGLEAQKLLQN